MASNYDVLIGEEMRIQRILHKMTLKEMASHLGCSYNTVAYYEKGKIPITVQTLIKYCEALNVDYIELLKKVSN